MLIFFKQNKFKLIFFTSLIILSLLYLFINNSCLNLKKTIKSYRDFGFSNIRPCIISDSRGLIRQKSPKLFSTISKYYRHYFSNYNKDILELNTVKNYSLKEKELFKDVLDLSKKGIKGVLNDKNFKINYKNNDYKKSYNYYTRQNKDNSNTKFYNEIDLGLIKNNKKPKLAWKHVSLKPNSKTSKWKRLVETSPVYINGKIIYLSADLRLIALNASNGSLIWEKELLHFPSMRGFLVEKDIFNKEYVYICIGSNLYKLNAVDGNLIKSFGDSGKVEVWTAFSPVLYKNMIVITSRTKIHGFDKNSGKEKFSIPIFKNKNYIGALPWGGMALDDKKGIIYFGTGNPRPKVYGSKRQGVNEGSNTLFAIDLNKKKVVWKFKETFHDLWNLDIAFPPIIADIKVKNKNYEVVICATKIGNILMLERSSGRPIFDIDFIRVPKSKISSEIASPFQIKVTQPEPITKFDWSIEDMSQIENDYKNKILNNINDFEFGLFVPPAINKSYIYMAEGPIWEGGAYNSNKQKMYLTANHTPAITRMFLRSLWPHSKIIKDYPEAHKLYKNKCASCHGVNRNGRYVSGKKPENKAIAVSVIPTLVGYHLFPNLKNKISDFENFKKKHSKNLLDKNAYQKINLLFEKWDNDLLKNKRINVNEMTSAFVDENKNLMANYPHGEIVSYDLSNGNIEWKVPFGYKNGKNLGTFNKGGLALSNDGILFATGTPDKKIYALNSLDGKELWSYEMELSGNAPPLIYEYDGSKYLSVIATGGYNFYFPDRGSILYTFKIE